MLNEMKRRESEGERGKRGEGKMNITGNGRRMIYRS